MRTPALPLVICLTLGLAGCGTMDPVAPSTGDNLNAPDGIDPKQPNIERSTHSIDFTDVRLVRLELPVGRVSITQSAGTAATLRVAEIITREGLPVERLTELLNQTHVAAGRAFVDQSRLDVTATLAPELNETEILFDVRLVLPAAANIEVIVNSGPVEVSELTGNLEIRTDNGAVDIINVAGDVTASTTGRPITVMDVVGNVSATTSNADIDLRLMPGANGRISAATTAGKIRLMVPKTTAARVLLTADNGAVTANLNGFAVTDISTSAGFLEGTLNGGGGAIELTSLGGEIIFLGM